MLKSFSIDHTRLAADYCSAIRAALTPLQLITVNDMHNHDFDSDYVHEFVDANDCIESALNAQGHSLLDGNCQALEAANRAMAKGKAHWYKLRRVIVGCEFSGRTRDAIAAHGHDVTSCDIIETEVPGKHIIGDLRDYMNDGYTDMLSFPPCTFLCAASAKHRKGNFGRWRETVKAIEFVKDSQGHSLLDGNQLSVDAGNRATQKARQHGYQLRRVIVGCEFSGRTRDAIAAHGHDVTSCDIIETEVPGKHIIGDLRDYMNDGYTDMLSFPPCTFLCAASAKHRKGNFGRWRETVKAIEFVKDLLSAKVERSALENSVGILPRRIGKWSQVVQTYHYGEDHSKRTCLWLDELPLLTNDPADHIAPRIVTLKNGKLAKRWANQSDESGADNTPESPERWRIRSRIKHGLANAFAAQWFNTERLAA